MSPLGFVPKKLILTYCIICYYILYYYILLHYTLHCVTTVLQSCKWGYRANPLSVCEPCTSPLPLYDWMYLLFMVLISFVLHCIAIDINTNRKRFEMQSITKSLHLEVVRRKRKFILRCFLDLISYFIQEYD